jgi:hypothetical protein
VQPHRRWRGCNKPRLKLLLASAELVEPSLKIRPTQSVGNRVERDRRACASPPLILNAQQTVRSRPLVARNEHRWLQGQPVEHINQIALFGYAPRLGLEDLDWLLVDAKARTADHQRKLAITTALGIWRDAGFPPESLARIEEAAGVDPVLDTIVQYWVRPPEPASEKIKQAGKYKALRKQRAEEQAARDRSWVEFINRLRENPSQLRNIPPPTPEGVDARLYHLWLLLFEAGLDANNRYAINTVTALEPRVTDTGRCDAALSRGLWPKGLLV